MSDLLQSKSPADSQVMLTQMMGILESNTLGNVHGGVLMRICDEAGALAAVKHAGNSCVTVAVDRMTFDAPVRIGNVVSFEARVTWVGRTSIETQIVVTSENVRTGEKSHTNTAHFVYVALDDDGKATSVPSLQLETEEDKRLHAAATERQEYRLQMRRKQREASE